MKTIRRIELLAPAKNVEIGQQAILHGADAVYIGAPRFGARSTAGNSIADLTRLIDFAHRFDARVYITLNTIYGTTNCATPNDSFTNYTK